RHPPPWHHVLCHSLSGDCLRSLQIAKQRRIPSIVDVPPCHRDGGKQKFEHSKIAAPPGKISSFQRWKARLLLHRRRFIEEYKRADLLLVLSERAAETLRIRSFTELTLFYLRRCVV